MRESPRDAIAAISTAAGTGAIAIVRISGEGALEVADAIFEGASLSAADSHTVHHGRVVNHDGGTVDEVLAMVMRAPRTYTTEDMVEFGCHGGDVPARRVLALLLEKGARLARRGEFTERAFIGGRLDLVQAEAVADIVAARTDRAMDAALGQLEGRLSSGLSSLREMLVDLRAEVDALVDFPDEDLPGRTREELLDLAAGVTSRISRMLAHCELGRAVRDGVTVAIVGRPNVGKSSIMNALLERDRSIVTTLPGTTRDTVEDLLCVSGVAIRLIDTAGWRTGGDEAEQAGVARAIAATGRADVALLVLDGSQALCAADASVASSVSTPVVVAALNKSDLPQVVEKTEARRLAATENVCVVSALLDRGIDELRAALVRAATGCDPAEKTSVTNVRHVDALRRCSERVVAAAACVRSGEPVELASVELQEATEALGEITGEAAPEEILERIFSRFCVGK